VTISWGDCFQKNTAAEAGTSTAALILIGRSRVDKENDRYDSANVKYRFVRTARQDVEIEVFDVEAGGVAVLSGHIILPIRASS
jgi:hypothetical protein